MQQKSADIEKTYDELSNQGFPQEKLSAVVSQNIVQNILWPSDLITSSQKWCLLLVWLLKTQRHLNQATYSTLTPDQTKLTAFLRLVLHLSLNHELSFPVRSACLAVIIDAFSNLDIVEVQRACQQFVSISCWHNLLPEHREAIFRDHPKLKKRYKARLKSFEAAAESEKQVLQFERDYVFSLVKELSSAMNTQRSDAETLKYCCKILELFTILLGQLPTRRYLVPLFDDLHLATTMRLSQRRVKKLGPTLELQMLDCASYLFEVYLSAPYDNVEGSEISARDAHVRLSSKILELQHIAFTDFKDSLTLLALSNHSNIHVKSKLLTDLGDLSETDLIRLCDRLAMRTRDFYESLALKKSTILREVLSDVYEKKVTYRDHLQDLVTLPTELSIFSSTTNALAHNLDTASIVLPKLTLQYLSINDLLYRCYLQHQASAWLSLRSDFTQTIDNLDLIASHGLHKLINNGRSLNALLIQPPSILEVNPPRIMSHGHPDLVRGQVKLELGSYNELSWQELLVGDIVYFLHIELSDQGNVSRNSRQDPSFLQNVGLKRVRSAVVEAILDGEGRPIATENSILPYRDASSLSRTLRVLFDTRAFQKDKEEQVLEGVYENLNLLVKRPSERNNYSAVLEGIRTLFEIQWNVIPFWLRESILGFGSVAAPDDGSDLPLMDTFVDERHIEETLPSIYGFHPSPGINEENTHENYHQLTNAGLKELLISRGLVTTGNKPDLIKRMKDDDVAQAVSKLASPSAQAGQVAYFLSKDRAESDESEGTSDSRTRVLVSKPVSSSGLKSADRVHRNKIRYSPSQVKAICAAMFPGLCVIDGPAGSGKSLVVSQVLNNLYHSNRPERSLVLCSTHTNATALVSRLQDLGVHSTHLLQIVASGLSPQIDKVLQNRTKLLLEVTKLAKSLHIEGDHGTTCETAEYFFVTKIKPRIDLAASADDVPFGAFFSGAVESPEQVENRISYVESIFRQLRDLRPIELLRSKSRQEEYLLSKGARIVIMTASQAFLKQKTYAELGMHFNNIILEQASSLSELQSLCPFAFIRDLSKFSRVILAGDIMQLSSTQLGNPSIARDCMANQSLFERLVRTGCTVHRLKEQGRSRPSLVDIYRHRYPEIINLPNVQSGEYTTGNAGLLHSSQFVNVDDYNGQGELSPRLNVWQNLGEAEYVVALYQYMRLLDYAPDRIVILTPFGGQKRLIQEVLNARCRGNKVFGLPTVSTVAAYQSQESDYVLLSLVRTSISIELADQRMLTTALSRARLGLYVFGRRSALPPSTMSFFEPLMLAPDDKLELVTVEMYGSCTRLEKESSNRVARMENVMHLGKYVYEMTQTRLAHMTST